MQNSSSYPGAGLLRDVALPLSALLAALVLPFSAILAAYIVGGQAHFFMAYRYQWKGKKVTRLYIAAAILLALAAYWYLAGGAPFSALLLFTGTLFAAHFSFDEFTLHGERHDRAAYVSVVGFTLLFAVLVTSLIAPAFPSAIAYAAVALGYAAVRLTYARSPLASAERYLMLVAALLVLLALSGFGYQVLGVVILLHVANWYVGYGARLAQNPPRARSYWLEVFITLGVMIALYAAYHNGFGPLGVLFSAVGYYLWAVAHIILSVVALGAKRAVQ